MQVLNNIEIRMKLKNLFFLGLLIQSWILVAQNNLFVVYRTGGLGAETKTTLIADKTTSVYEEGLILGDVNTIETSPNSFVISGQDHMKIYQNFKNRGIVKIKLFKNEDRFSYIDKDYYILDTIPTLNWEMESIRKNIEIQGFVCKEATLEFRGSVFKAYYTTEIPVPFGPWKFHGLPGLILKIYSLENPHNYWEAEEIVYPYDMEIEDDNTEMTFNLSMKDYIKQHDELVDKRARATAARMGSNYQPIPQQMRRDKGRERKYEWETW